jgi:hypothetical protein
MGCAPISGILMPEIPILIQTSTPAVIEAGVPKKPISLSEQRINSAINPRYNLLN